MGNNIIVWMEIGVLYLLGVFLIMLSLILIPVHFTIKALTGYNLFGWYRDALGKTIEFIEERYG